MDIMEFTLEKMEKYFSELNIKTYWSEKNLRCLDLSEILRTFELLHNKYPKIEIKEIGDFLTCKQRGFINEIEEERYKKGILGTFNYKNRRILVNKVPCHYYPRIITHEFVHALAEDTKITENNKAINLYSEFLKDNVYTSGNYAKNSISDFVCEMVVERDIYNTENKYTIGITKLLDELYTKLYT